MSKVDDGAMVFIGDAAYDCCKPGEIPTGSADTAALFSYKAWDAPSDASYVWIYFEAGSYYPIRIVYANVISAGGIDLSVTAPGDSSAVNIGALVYQLVNDDSVNKCVATTITTTFQSSTTFIYSKDVATTVTIPQTITVAGTTTVVIEKQVYFTSYDKIYTSYISGSSYYTSSYVSTIVDNGNTLPAEVIVIGVPLLSTTSLYTNVQATKTLTSQIVVTGVSEIYTSSVIVVEEPNLQYTYIPTKVNTLYTTTSAFTTTVKGKPIITSDIVVVGPSVETLTTFYNGAHTSTFMTTSVIVHDGKTSTSRGYVVEYPRGTSTEVWGTPTTSQYTTTVTLTKDGVMQTSAYIVKLVPSYSYVYSSGTDTVAHTKSFTRTKVENGITSQYVEIDIVYPTPYTSISVGTVGSTYTTTQNGHTYVVVEETDFPTTTSFWNKNYVTTTFSPVVTGTSTGWEWEIIYPTPSTTVYE